MRRRRRELDLPRGSEYGFLGSAMKAAMDAEREPEPSATPGLGGGFLGSAFEAALDAEADRVVEDAKKAMPKSPLPPKEETLGEYMRRVGDRIRTAGPYAGPCVKAGRIRKGGHDWTDLFDGETAEYAGQMCRNCDLVKDACDHKWGVPGLVFDTAYSQGVQYYMSCSKCSALKAVYDDRDA